jgi:hypothetical protein
VPIWIGGRTRRSLRRPVTLADGWCPFNVSIATAAEWLQARELPAGFDVVLPADQPLDHSLEHYLEQIHALAELHGKTFSRDVGV